MRWRGAINWLMRARKLPSVPSINAGRARNQNESIECAARPRVSSHRLRAEERESKPISDRIGARIIGQRGNRRKLIGRHDVVVPFQAAGTRIAEPHRGFAHGSVLGRRARPRVGLASRASGPSRPVGRRFVVYRSHCGRARRAYQQARPRHVVRRSDRADAPRRRFLPQTRRHQARNAALPCGPQGIGHRRMGRAEAGSARERRLDDLGALRVGASRARDADGARLGGNQTRRRRLCRRSAPRRLDRV